MITPDVALSQSLVVSGEEFLHFDTFTVPMVKPDNDDDVARQSYLLSSSSFYLLRRPRVVNPAAPLC